MNLKEALDKYCRECGKKMKKYIGRIMGTDAVLYKPLCKCTTIIPKKKISITDNKLFDKLQTPFWKLMGQKPKERDAKLEKFLKRKGWSYGDWRRHRDYQEGRFQSAYPKWEDHLKRYGRDNAPPPNFQKEG